MGYHLLICCLQMTPYYSSEKDEKSLEAIKRILSWYCSISRQCVNLCKFDLYCSPNMDRGEQEALAFDLQVNLVQNPSKYLRINFKLRGGKVADFQFWWIG